MTDGANNSEKITSSPYVLGAGLLQLVITCEVPFKFIKCVEIGRVFGKIVLVASQFFEQILRANFCTALSLLMSLERGGLHTGAAYSQLWAYQGNVYFVEGYS